MGTLKCILIHLNVLSETSSSKWYFTTRRGYSQYVLFAIVNYFKTYDTLKKESFNIKSVIARLTNVWNTLYFEPYHLNFRSFCAALTFCTLGNLFLNRTWALFGCATMIGSNTRKRTQGSTRLDDGLLFNNVSVVLFTSSLWWTEHYMTWLTICVRC